jgi:hypothetical protein
MATPSDFRKYYSTVSNTELLSILDNPHDYQPSALEAAKEELAKRQLSDNELEEARLPLVQRQTKKALERERVEAVESRFKLAGHHILETLNPFQPGITATERLIRLVIVIFGGLFLYEFIVGFSINLAYIKDLTRFPLESSIVLAPQLILLLGIILFWMRKAWGWVLLTMYSSFFLVATLWLAFQSTSRDITYLPEMEGLFARPSLFDYGLQVALSGGMLFLLGTQKIRNAYRISDQRMVATLFFSALGSLILLMLVS